MGRPICVHCGAKYGNRDTKSEYVIWPQGEPMPSYGGNLKLVSTRQDYTAPHNVSGSFAGKPFTQNDNVARLTLWDGTSYWQTSYNPFCTLRCALDYARKAWSKHGRI